jgi:hypothetical protein
MPEENEITKEIEAKLAQLPPDVRNAIEASDFEQKVGQIGQAHGLHIDQIELLGTEVYMVMLGMTNPDEFAQNVEKEVRVSKEQAAKIAEDVNTKILGSIRSLLKSMYRGAESGASTPAAEPAASAGMPADTKSVVMPSAAVKAPAAPPAPAAPLKPATTMPTMPVASAPVSSAAPAVPPAPLGVHKPSASVPDLNAAQTALTQKTVQLPTATVPVNPLLIPQKEAPKPGAYAADPYREPIE